MLAAEPAVRAWIDSRFGRHLGDAAANVLGDGAEVELVADGHAAAPAHDRTMLSGAWTPPDEDALSPKLTFDQFVIGDCNRFAHAAALAVAELPGQAYNPLFIYGPPGVGKTHLLHSIGNYVRRFGEGLTVRATTTEQFTSDFVTAVRTGGLDAFKGRFRRADVLLIDDVQFLESKVKTEEEFFHTFNALHEAGSQLVLTSDRLPRDLDALEDRLRERFEAGLVADIGAPDRAVRLAVLRKRVQHDGIDLAEPEALDVIADRVTDNVRALEGALIRVVAFHSLTGRRLDAALAAEVLDGLYPAPLARISQPAPPDHRAHPAAHVRGVRPDDRGARVARAHRPSRLAQAGRHVPVPRAHRPEPPRHRQALRRPQPHHRHARLPAHQRPSRLRPGRLRGCAQPVRASARRPVTTGRLATLCTRVRTGAVRAFPAACGPMPRCAHVHSPYDFKPFQMRSEVTS